MSSNILPILLTAQLGLKFERIKSLIPTSQPYDLLAVTLASSVILPCPWRGQSQCKSREKEQMTSCGASPPYTLHVESAQQLVNVYKVVTSCG